MRDQDLFARLGGEEFSLIVPTTAIAGAVHLVDKLRQVVAGAVDTPDRHPLTFSAGVAEWHPDETLDDLFQRADAALYRAKANGRNQVAAAPGVVPKLPFAPPTDPEDHPTRPDRCGSATVSRRPTPRCGESPQVRVTTVLCVWVASASTASSHGTTWDVTSSGCSEPAVMRSSTRGISARAFTRPVTSVTPIV